MGCQHELNYCFGWRSVFVGLKVVVHCSQMSLQGFADLAVKCCLLSDAAGSQNPSSDCYLRVYLEKECSEGNELETHLELVLVESYSPEY